MNNKKNPVRSSKLRDSARGQECTLRVAGVCNYNPETTVLAHLDSEVKGMAIKSADTFAVYTCSCCHEWLDRHQGSREERSWYSLRALDRTHRVMVQQGLLVVAA